MGAFLRCVGHRYFRTAAAKKNANGLFGLGLMHLFGARFVCLYITCIECVFTHTPTRRVSVCLCDFSSGSALLTGY